MNERNFNQIIEELKKRVNDYTKKIEIRENALKEIKDLTYLLNKVREEINKLEKQYVITPILKFQKEIEDYKKQEKDYIALINEYATQIKNIVISDINKEEKEFLELALKFQNISKKMKEIEKVSKKYGKKRDILTDRIETVNAENRKQYIYKDLLDDYNELVRMKKLILPVYKRKYNEFIMRYKNNVSLSEPIQEKNVTYYNNQRLGIAPSYIPTNEEYIQMSNQDKKHLEDKYYQDMAEKEKKSYCEDILNKILYSKNTGKKEYIKIDGNNYYVPKKLKSKFYEYYKKLKLLTNKNKIVEDNKIVIDEQTNIFTVDNYIQIEDENIIATRDNVVAVEQSLTGTVEEDHVVNKYFITDDNNSEAEQDISKINIEDNIFIVDNYIQVEDENKTTTEDNIEEPVLEEQPVTGTVEEDRVVNEYFITDDNNSEAEQNISKINIEDNIFTVDDYIQIEDENIIAAEGESNNHEIPDDTYKVIKTKKSKNRKGLIKRITAAALAIAASLTIVQSIKSLMNNNDQIDDISNSISNLDNSIEKDIQVEQEINKIIDQNKNQNETKGNHTEKSKNIFNSEQNVDTIKIGDTVCVKNGAPIYSNVYDAMTKANRKKAYFPASKQRYVLGIFIKYNHKFFYYENQTEIDELMRKGGVIKSYVIGDGGYEGAFHPDDMIKQQSKVKVNK